MEYTVTDRGGYEEITLTGWGEATHYVAAEAINGDRVTSYFLEPADRLNGDDWDEDAEWRFRDDIKRFVSSWEMVPEYLVFDPDRDSAEEIPQAEFGYATGKDW